MWGKLGKSPAEVDYEVLEDEFAAKQAVMQLGNGGGAQQRPKQAMLLPLQRAQNVGVFLTRLKMGPAEVSKSAASAALVHSRLVCAQLKAVTALCGDGCTHVP